MAKLWLESPPSRRDRINEGLKKLSSMFGMDVDEKMIVPLYVLTNDVALKAYLLSILMCYDENKVSKAKTQCENAVALEEKAKAALRAWGLT